MAATFTKIATVTVGSGGASSIDFSSIPATYTDLCLKVSMRDNRATVVQNNLQVTFNGSSSAYSERIIYGNGSSASSANTSGSFFNFVYTNSAGSTSSTFSNMEMYIPNYAGSNYKSMSIDLGIENNATATWALLGAYLWSNTAAITQITINPDGAYTFQQYSTATLYGIKNS